MVGLAHDLRSPSVAINGYSSLLMSAETDDERRDIVEGIATSSAYLHQLVDSLIELSRVGATQTEIWAALRNPDSGSAECADVYAAI